MTQGDVLPLNYSRVMESITYHGNCKLVRRNSQDELCSCRPEESISRLLAKAFGSMRDERHQPVKYGSAVQSLWLDLFSRGGLWVGGLKNVDGSGSEGQLREDLGPIHNAAQGRGPQRLFRNYEGVARIQMEIVKGACPGAETLE
jgi:hypothetical protein